MAQYAKPRRKKPPERTHVPVVMPPQVPPAEITHDKRKHHKRFVFTDFALI